jgi:predicted DNA-binding protein (UPF0251 family)
MANAKNSIQIEIDEQTMRDSLADALRHIANSISTGRSVDILAQEDGQH